MRGILQAVWRLVKSFFSKWANIAFENIALRHQLAVLQRSVERPKIHRRDRILWSWLLRLWPRWQSVLLIVRPETVIGWHKQGFKLYWRWKSRAKQGRPCIERDIRDLIRRMSRENPTWGAPRIQSELRLLGHEVADSTVARYMVRQRKPPSQTWRTFLANHMKQTAAIDFFTVPTVTFRVLFCFIVLMGCPRFMCHTL